MLSRYVLDKLEGLAYRITPQRKAILQVLEDNRGKHLSAEQIYLKVRKKRANIGMATVYRTLDALDNLGILHKTSFDEGLYRYEFCTEDRHHHHLICLTCGNIVEIEEDLLQYLKQKVEDKGFKVEDHNLVIYGVCQNCQ